MKRLSFPRSLRSSVVCCALLATMFMARPNLSRAEAVKPFEKIPDVFSKKNPETVDELKVMNAHTEQVIARVMPCVVSVRIGAAFGSGVIVSKEGYILTAGHVSGQPNRDVTVYFHDGKKAKGKTLGGNHGIDSGLIQITTEGDWPYLEIGDSGKLKAGQWCMVCAHPGGYKPGRTPPVRLGRLSRVTGTTVTSDCILVGGDSGGPLLDMQGRVIAINSRIGTGLDANMHVPVNPYKESWDKLVAGETWGKLGFPGGQPAKNQPWLGIGFDPDGKGCIIQQVVPDSPAAKAGLKADDVITKFDGKEIDDRAALITLVRRKMPGDRVVVEIRRGDETMTINVTIGKN